MATSTAPTPPSEASSSKSALEEYLSIAPARYFALNGSLPSGSSGGSTALIAFNPAEIPVQPRFITGITHFIKTSLTLTVPAGDSITVSPFFPWCLFSQQQDVGGAALWKLTEHTAWFLDNLRHRINYQPAKGAAGNEPSNSAANPVNNDSIIGITYPTGGSPGETLDNSGTTTETYTYTVNYVVHQKYQRKRHLLWGAIPMGDPETRPSQVLQLNALIGAQPEVNAFVNASSSSVTAVTATATTVTSVLELSYIDMLYPNVPSSPKPMVNFALNLNASRPNLGLSAGNIASFVHREGMLYTAIDSILVSGGLPIPADYFALWDSQAQSDARTEYDGSVNTMQEYYWQHYQRYQQWPQNGVYSLDFDDGDFPPIPSATPYVGWMSPDQDYAKLFGIPVTPAMSTALRIPSSVSPSNPYVRQYSWGFVQVPY